MRSSTTKRKLSSIFVAGALVATGLGVTVLTAPAASADPGPVLPITATMPTADALPTAQIDGVAWTQQIVTNTVYVGGKFANARPAGAAAGTGLTARTNMLSYNLSTGVLNSGFNPAPNNQVYAIAASPDGKRIYIGGTFTAVGGVTRNRIAAVDATTGALITTFAAGVDYTVKSIVATDTTVYIAGAFTNANSTARTRFAAFNATNGALMAWAPTADATVNAMVLSPDGAIIAGGAFANVNGSPAYGLAKIDATSGALLGWNATNLIRNAGANSAILSLKTDGQNIFGSGYTFGSGGNLEGAFSADPATGNINYVEDCHGDSYDVWPGADAVFTVSHAHYCGNIGGFPQSDPWSVNMRHALAYTKRSTGTAAHDPLGYYDYFGTPTPSLIHWFPQLDPGTYTGKSQAAWSITGNSQYLVLGGEFPKVNGAKQQGLVRFAVRPVASGKSGPQYGGAAINPSVIALGANARIAWQANTDMDDANLTYTLTRNGAQVYQTTAASNFWTRPTMGFMDSAVTAGTLYKYRLSVSDPSGNTVQSEIVNYTAPAAATQNAYAKRVLADGAAPYWPMNETSGTTLFDNAGFNDADTGAGITRGTAGAVTGDAATTFDGATSASTRGSIVGPNTFTAQAWINTTTTSGGKIIGFGNAQTGTSSAYDRHVYMDNGGRIWFGVYPNGVAALNSSASFNDGKWHQITASLGAAGMKLYIDDKLVGQRSDVTWGQAYSGFWRVGGDNIGGWPNQPASNTFAGAIDEVAVYPTALSGAAIDAQWVASGRAGTAPANQAPTAAFTSTVAAMVASFDASGSADADGSVASYAWNFGDGSTGTGQTPSHTYAAGGTFTVTLTVTDNQGATGAITEPVTVAPPAAPGALIKDTFGRTTASGWGTAETGGVWTVAGGAANFTVGTGTGNVMLTGPGAGPSAIIAAPSSADVSITVDTAVDKMPSGGGTYLSVGARKVGTSGYRTTVKLLPTGVVQVQLIKTVNGTSTTLKAVTAAGLTFAAGTSVSTRFQITGSTTVALSARVWKTGAAEPAAWSATATDATAPLSATGPLALYPYLSASSVAGVVTATYDNVAVFGVAP